MTRSITLAIEGATYQGSVAVIRDAEVVAERTLQAEDGGIPRAGRGERLMPAVAECLDEAGVCGSDIARIVCGAGPGSFTSLRVAGSVAKGLAAGYGVELYAVSSLLLIVSGAQPSLPNGKYLSVLDAMRGEFYCARILLQSGVAVQSEAPILMSADGLEEVRLRERALRIVGPGQEIDAHPHARGVAPILAAIVESGPVNLASWEPDYGRLAEAQVRWEAAHGRPLTT
ncbi:MAG TPA: tRNA (adenosine(37)-N6)-threonylcarbamoyltransferase complex dimerization subunit type 1 TsaB [Candidatus Limnocylindrales bacterium]|jgi:tRNA threonylcarbamoyladenosine biosynthesis protein TsaB|nr:tRNA (adenosine(37)-N6)-threonylcarbamoyltransferase complex dimerization subunit type 1 TsaB [Candidatus Limnocylindrales bacterium]